MAKSLKIIEGYRKRAYEELEVSKSMLLNHFYAASISRAYYAVYYAITAVLLERGIITKTHKQTGVEFRRHFIKTKQFDKKYSKILDELFNIRMISDYDAIPEIDEETAKHLVQEAYEFVEEILDGK